MKFKIGEMKTKEIMNGIFITGLIYFIIVVPNILVKYLFLLVPGTPGFSIIYFLDSRKMYSIHTITVTIIFLILFKLVCEALYKIVKACEIIIEKYNNG